MTLSTLNILQLIFLSVSFLWIVVDLLCGQKLLRTRNSFLAVLALIALGSWYNFFQIPESSLKQDKIAKFDLAVYIHKTDSFHYYIGSKYFNELGYKHLYVCTALAELQLGYLTNLSKKSLRDLRDDSIVEAEKIRTEIENCNSRFTEDRWSSFKEDIDWFRARMSQKKWETVFYDHGFNATPVWLIVGQFVSNAISLDSKLWFVPFILDALLLCLMWLVVFRVFGVQSGALSLIAWSTLPLSDYGWVGGALLRHDWLVLTVVGLCMLKQGRYVVSAMSLAYGGLLRMFSPCDTLSCDWALGISLVFWTHG